MAHVGTRLLTITTDGVDRSAEVSNCRLPSGAADSDFVPFAVARSGGGREYKLALTLVQDLSPGSLWREVWDNVGDTIPFTIAPYGNGAASESQPHVVGTCVIGEPDGDMLGGEANPSPTARFTMDVEWTCPEKPTLVTTPSAATTATAGTPGAFNGTTPANLAALSGITAFPSSAWTEGQHVVLGDASKAHWDGSTWTAGEAS